MISYILVVFMIFLILIKILAMTKVSKDNFSSAIVTDWTVAHFKSNRIEELSKEKKNKLKLYIYLSSSLDIFLAIATIIVVPWAETGLFLILGLLLYLNPLLFGNIMNRKLN